MSRNPREIWATLAAITLITTIIGCAALTAPKSFDDRLAYAYGVHTAVLNAAAASVEAGDLTADQGRAVLDIARQSRTILDAAHAASRLGDIREAEAQLELAGRLLTELQSYLRRQP